MHSVGEWYRVLEDDPEGARCVSCGRDPRLSTQRQQNDLSRTTFDLVFQTDPPGFPRTFSGPGCRPKGKGS